MEKGMLDYNLKVRLPIVILVAVMSYFTTFFYSFDERNGIGYAPEQPIKYSHKLHAGDMKIDCRYCHVGAEKGRHATIPSVDTCMNCHSVVKTDSPEIKKLHKYFNEGKALPWNRIHRSPDHVYFNHSVHLAKGFDCADCHGDVASMEVVKQTKLITMGRCLDCHRETHKETVNGKTITKQNGPQDCVACHR